MKIPVHVLPAYDLGVENRFQPYFATIYVSPQGQHFGDGAEASLWGRVRLCRFRHKRTRPQSDAQSVENDTNVPVPKVTPKVTLPRVTR